MYSFDSRIRYSEVDCQGKITFHSILDYFQDCSSFHSEDLQVGISYLDELGAAWVLVSWQIEVKRYPQYGEMIKVSTWPHEFKGFYGSRNFQMTDMNGNKLAYANSLWVLLDQKNKRPMKVQPRMMEAYQLKQPLEMTSASRKIKLPEDLAAKEPFEVHKFHLDTNLHVNNGKYILMAQEYLPEGFIIQKMHAEYKKSAVYGDKIYPSVLINENKVVIILGNEEHKPYAVIELEDWK